MGLVTAYYDYASPYSYFAHVILERDFAVLDVDWVPVYQQALPRFAKGLPYDHGKLAYVAKDIFRVAKHEEIDFAQPATFPMDTRHALRAALVAKAHGPEAFAQFHRVAFRSVWRDAVDLADRVVVADILRDALGPHASSELPSSFTAQRYKDQLRANNETAVARGLFGVPTFFVGDEMYWGHDRIEYMVRAAAALM